MADVKWIKITTDIFDDEKILLIESLPEADSIIVIWFKLLCLAGKQNNSGVFMMNDNIPYTDKMLATIFRRKESTVKIALETFAKFGMVEIVDNVITIPKWGKHQSIDQLENKREYMREYMADYRQKQKQIACKTNSKTNSKTNVSTLDKNRLDKNRLDKTREDTVIGSAEPKHKPEKHKYGEYNNVMLTDDEIAKLRNDYGIEKTDKAITFLDAYIEEKGYKAKSHYLSMKRWVFKAVEEAEAKKTTKTKNKTAEQLDDFYGMAADWSIIDDLQEVRE